MKKTRPSKSANKRSDDLREEYDFDYSKARPNRFAERASKDRLVVVLDGDLAKVFKTSDAVKNALRALISAVPTAAKRKVR